MEAMRSLNGVMQQTANAIGNLVGETRNPFLASIDHQTADVMPCQNRGEIIGYALTVSLALDSSIIQV